MRRKKILYVITKSVWGGAQKYVYDLATNLPQDRFEAAVITGGNGLLVEKLNLAGIRTITLSTLQRSNAFGGVLFSLANIRALFTLISIYRKERPDVIHLNSSKIGGLGAVAAFIYKNLQPTTYNLQPKVVFTVHGWGFKENRPWWQKSAIFFLSWFSSLFHDKVILINTADYRTAKRFISQRKLALIHNGIEPIDFFPREEARAFFAKKIGRPIVPDTLIIGTIAEHVKNKGLPYLISALRMLNTECLTLMLGQGKDTPLLQSQIESYNLQNSVFLPGFIPNASRYLTALDVFVLPSLKEGLPYTIMEAMAAGLPIVATDVGGIPDLIKPGENGLLVPARDPEALAEALKNVIEDKRLRSKFSGASLRIMETKFSLSQMIQETIALYV